MTRTRTACALVLASLAAGLAGLQQPASADPVAWSVPHVVGWQLAAGPDGSTLVVDASNAGGWATPGAWDEEPDNWDAFLTRFDATGRVVWATYFGGSGGETATAAGFAPDGGVYVAGSTELSADSTFPITPGSLGEGLGGPTQALGWLARFSAKGQLLWATLLPGVTYVFDLDVDAEGRAHIVGEPTADLPVTEQAFDKTWTETDGFVATVTADGTDFASASFLGGSSYDRTLAIEVESDGTAFVGGTTASSDLPGLGGGADSTLGGTEDAFVAKLGADGNSVTWSRFIGGSGGTINEELLGLDLTPDGGVVLTARGNSPDLPTTVGAEYPLATAETPAWMARLSGTDSTLVWATFIPHHTRPPAVDGTGRIHLVGIDTYPNPGKPDIVVTYAMLVSSTGDFLREDLLVEQDPARLVDDDAASAFLLSTPLTTNEGDPQTTTYRLTRLYACTINGTAGPDTLVGTAGSDVICGRGGNDVVSGGGGADVLILGDGDDEATGGSGQDVLLGGSGADEIGGGAERDRLVGSAGNDTLAGGDGSDLLLGGAGNDSLSGGSGQDQLGGGPGKDSERQ